MKKSRTHVSIYYEDKIRLDKKRFKLEQLEQKRLSNPEVLRRMLSDNAKEIDRALERDAYIKKMKRLNYGK